MSIDDNENDQCTTRYNNGPSKLGRKGDPRMHRAVAARLSSPMLTLLEALRTGGFDFPAIGGDDATLLDSDKVTLGQRKNQLSRRLRLAKQQIENVPGVEINQSISQASISQAASAGIAQARALQAASSGISLEAQLELEKLVQHSPQTNLNLPGMNIASTASMEEQTNGDDDIGAASRIAKKYQSQFNPILNVPSSRTATVTPWSNLGVGLDNAALIVAANANQPAVASSNNVQAAAQQQFQHLMAQTSAVRATQTAVPSHGQASFGSLNHLPKATPHSCAAVASLGTTAQSVGMTLEQLAVALTSAQNLAKVLNKSDPDAKQALALKLYQSEGSALHKRCMILAGFDSAEAQENHGCYLQFALKAWQIQGKRLGEMNSVELSQLVGTDSAKKKHGANSTEKGRGGANDSKCFEGRHVHRLENKCGHRAIIHQPEDGPTHVDFMVDDTIECYQDIHPVGTESALWPSRYTCGEMDSCAGRGQDHKVNRVGLCPSVFVLALFEDAVYLSLFVNSARAKIGLLAILWLNDCRFSLFTFSVLYSFVKSSLLHLSVVLLVLRSGDLWAHRL